VNHIELLDQLFATRRELARLTAAIAAAGAPEASVTSLRQRRDQLNIQIQGLIAAGLSASLAEIDAACKVIDVSTGELKRLSGTASDVATAISITAKVLDVAGGLLTKI
jgi:hypothetical protein